MGVVAGEPLPAGAAGRIHVGPANDPPEHSRLDGARRSVYTVRDRAHDGTIPADKSAATDGTEMRRSSGGNPNAR